MYVALYDRVMHSLRFQVHQLEENELFEQALLRGSQAALEQQPTSNDINTLMRSMMSSTIQNNDANSTTIANGPWNGGNRAKIGTSDVTHRTTAGRSAKGKGRSRRD